MKMKDSTLLGLVFGLYVGVYMIIAFGLTLKQYSPVLIIGMIAGVLLINFDFITIKNEI